MDQKSCSGKYEPIITIGTNNDEIATMFMIEDALCRLCFDLIMYSDIRISNPKKMVNNIRCSLNVVS